MGWQSRLRSRHFSIRRSFSRQTIKGRCPFDCRKSANSIIQVLMPAQEVVALLNRIFMLKSEWEKRHALYYRFVKYHHTPLSLFPSQRDVGQTDRASLIEQQWSSNHPAQWKCFPGWYFQPLQAYWLISWRTLIILGNSSSNSLKNISHDLFLPPIGREKRVFHLTINPDSNHHDSARIQL